MKKINCLVRIIDEGFKDALETMLLYSGYFNIVGSKVENAGRYAVDTDEVVRCMDEESIFHREDLLIITDRYPLSVKPKAMVVELVGDESRGDYSESRDTLPSNTRYKDKVLTLFKYMSFSSVLRRILINFNLGLDKALPWQPGKTEDVIKVSLVGVMGGIGTSEIAKAIGTILFRNGYYPLGIDLSPVNISGCLRDEEDAGDMMEMIYGLKRGRTIDISLFSEEVNGARWLKRPIFNTYVEMIDVKTLESLNSVLTLSGIEVLLLDMGNQLNKNNREIIGTSDITIFVFPFDEEWIKSGLKGMEELLDMSLGKSFVIINDVKGKAGEESLEVLERDERIDLIIPNYESITERSIDTDFGNEIRYLVNKMLG